VSDPRATTKGMADPRPTTVRATPAKAPSPGSEGARAPGFRFPMSWLWVVVAIVAFKVVILPGLLESNHALVGKPVPKLRLPQLVGAPATQKGATPVELDKLAGKVVVLDFWAPWCGPCRQEMPVLDGIARKYAGSDVVVMGVLVDPDRDGARDVLAQGHIGYPQLDDDTGLASKAFTIRSLPSLVVVDRKGVVRTYRAGYTSEAELEAAIKSAM